MMFNLMTKISATLMIVASILLTGCNKKEVKEPEIEIKGIEISAGNLIHSNLSEIINLNAVTTYQDQEIVRVGFQGYIEKSFKDPGDEIRKGDLLFEIRTKESDAVKGILDEQSADFSGAVKIFARTNGILTELTHQTGEYISDGEQLAVVVDPRSLRFFLEVPFQYYSAITLNKFYTVHLPDGKDIQAKVSKRLPVIDPMNQTQRYILEPTKNWNLPSNLNLTVVVPLKSVKNATALPKSAVMANETQTEFWVMKLINDSLAVRVKIRKGIESDSLVQIIEPAFDESDRFIFKGAYGLPDTAKVLIEKEK